MPSEKALNQKKQEVQELVAKLKDAKSVVLVDYKGLNVENDSKLRAEMRKENIDYSVIKNTMLRFAFNETGYEAFVPYLEGSTAVAISQDEIAPAKILQKYVSKSKTIFNFKAGMINGTLMNPDQLKDIASLPPREGLIAQVAGSMNAIIASLARGISEVAKQKEAA